MIMQAYTSLATDVATPQSRAPSAVGEAATITSSFVSPSPLPPTLSLARAQWLCYEAAFDSKEGIVFLEDALGMAVDPGALQGRMGENGHDSAVLCHLGGAAGSWQVGAKGGSMGQTSTCRMA